MTEKPAKDVPAGAAEAASADESRRAISPAAARALAEAEVRRAEFNRKSSGQPRELNGRGGLDPSRYGDWEVKGIASDF